MENLECKSLSPSPGRFHPFSPLFPPWERLRIVWNQNSNSSSSSYRLDRATYAFLIFRTRPWAFFFFTPFDVVYRRIVSLSLIAPLWFVCNSCFIALWMYSTMKLRFFSGRLLFPGNCPWDHSDRQSKKGFLPPSLSGSHRHLLRRWSRGQALLRLRSEEGRFRNKRCEA